MSGIRTIVLLLVLPLLLTGCGKNSNQATEARQSLKRLHVPFSRDALIERLRSGDPLAVDLLLTAGLDPDEPDTNGVTPLMRFAMEGNDTAVQRLLDKGADVNARDKTGATALISAAGYGRTAIVQMLLDHGAKVNAKGNEGDTALIQAALNGHAAIVKLLLDHGVDINAKTNSGKTALQYAASKGLDFTSGEGRGEIVALLKQAGAQE